MLKISHIVYEHTSAIPVKHPYAILLVSKGEGVLKIDSQQTELIPGRAFLLKERQEVYLVGDMLIGYLLQFQKVLLDYFFFQYSWQRGRGLHDPKTTIPFTDHDLDAFCVQLCLIGHMINEIERRANIAHQYLFLFLRLVNRRAEEIATVLPENEYLMEEALKLVAAHYKEHRDIHFYASELATYEKRLNAVSWELRGKKFSAVLMERVIAEADLLLIGTRLSIKDIAFELGFSNQSNFTTYYTRAKGMSPRERRGNG